jgi:hypothetical protein
LAVHQLYKLIADRYTLLNCHHLEYIQYSVTSTPRTSCKSQAKTSGPVLLLALPVGAAAVAAAVAAVAVAAVHWSAGVVKSSLLRCMHV